MASMGRDPKRKSAYVRQQPKNNTPVHTEVLWGGGLWWGLCVSKTYANVMTKLRWECAKGYRWSMTPNNVQQGQWCPECAGW